MLFELDGDRVFAVNAETGGRDESDGPSSRIEKYRRAEAARNAE